MKNFILFLSILFISVMAIAFKAVEDFLQILAISESDAHDYVWNSFENGYFSYPGQENYKSLNPSVRVAMVKDIGAFARAYSKTDDFKNRYVEYRLGQKPDAPEKPKTTQELKDEYKANLQKSISDIETNMENTTGEVRTAMENALKMVKQQLQQIDDPDNAMFSKDVENARMQYYEGQQQEYQQQMADWETKYPESPDQLIRERLNYFLEASSDIDYAAKLVKNEYGNMVFVNPDYENKPGDWKMMFRAGKESVTAARQVAQEWLAGMK